MRAKENTYYIIDSTITGSLSPSQELATNREVVSYTDYDQYVTECEKLDIEPTEKLPEPEPIKVIRSAQGKAQLIRMSLYDEVLDIIEEIDNPIITIFWENDSHWNINSRSIKQIADNLNIDIQEFFKEASEIII